MQILEVFPNTKLVTSHSKALFWTFVCLFSLLGVGIILSLTSNDESSAQMSISFGDILWTVFGLLICLYFLNEIIRMDRFSKHQGPLLTFSPDGVTDHFYSETELKWDEIKYIGCRQSLGRESYYYFIIQPLHWTWKYRLQRLYSHPLKYQLKRLAIGGADVPQPSVSANRKSINTYLKPHAPRKIRRKKKRKWVTYVPYGILVLSLMVWVFGKFS